MKQKRNLKFKWQMEGEKDFDEEPVDALVSNYLEEEMPTKGNLKSWRMLLPQGGP